MKVHHHTCVCFTPLPPLRSYVPEKVAERQFSRQLEARPVRGVDFDENTVSTTPLELLFKCPQSLYYVCYILFDVRGTIFGS